MVDPTHGAFGVKDLYLTPLYAGLIYLFFTKVKERVLAGKPHARYFMPAFLVRLAGGVTAGLIYNFYYGGGDTFTYFHGATLIGEAFFDNPYIALKILMSSPGAYDPDTAEYIMKSPYYGAASTFFVVKIAGIFAILSFNSYVVICLFFASIGFLGSWALYEMMLKLFPDAESELAWATLFIPSVVFWGSGLMKDTLTLAVVCFITYSVYHIVFERRRIILNSLIILVSCYVLIVVKMYIFLSFFPPLLFWLFLDFKNQLASPFLRKVSTPFVLALALFVGYQFILEVGAESRKYALDNFAKAAGEAQNWHIYLAETQGGSGYSLGAYDPTLTGTLKKLPQAVNVTLFRPYLWEVKNPLMLLASLESTAILLMMLYLLLRVGRGVIPILANNTFLIFCLIFTIAFSFAVGFTAYNFGALSRYQIPCMPFFVATLFILIRKHVSKGNTAHQRGASAVSSPA